MHKIIFIYFLIMAFLLTACSTRRVIFSHPQDTENSKEMLQFLEWQRQVDHTRNSITMWDLTTTGILAGSGIVIFSTDLETAETVSTLALLFAIPSLLMRGSAINKYHKLINLGKKRGWIINNPEKIDLFF